MKHAPNCMIGRMEWQNTRMHEMGCTCGTAQRDTPERSGTAREAPGSEGPQGAAHSPMTGDGAVVRAAHVRAKQWAEVVVIGANAHAETNPVANLARAYLEREAEIERLTQRLDLSIADLAGQTKCVEIHKTRATALTVENQALKDAASAAIDECVALDKRTADLLKALPFLIEICDAAFHVVDGAEEESRLTEQPVFTVDLMRLLKAVEAVEEAEVYIHGEPDDNDVLRRTAIAAAKGGLYERR